MSEEKIEKEEEIEEVLPAIYRTEEGQRTLANYFRSQNGIKSRSGIEHEKRIDYFKGKRLVECVLEGKKWPKSLPKIKDRNVARIVGDLLIQGGFFHRSEKLPEKAGYFKISLRNVFEETGYYTWMYAGNMMWTNVATGLIIAVVIGFTLMPIWPNSAKKILWYCAVTFLLLTLSFCTIRFLFFLIMWLAGYDFWILPRLFDESLTMQDSFKPLYSLEKDQPGQGYYRISLIVALAGFVYWACTQPTEFDGFIKAQKDFIDDLYSGNLLADVAHVAKSHTADRLNRMPNIADLIREMEADAIAEKAEQEEGEQRWVQPEDGDTEHNAPNDASESTETVVEEEEEEIQEQQEEQEVEQQEVVGEQQE